MEDLALKHGYYFVVDRDDSTGKFVITCGPQYIKDGVESFSIERKNGFISFYTNDTRKITTDESLVAKPYPEIVDLFENQMAAEYTKAAFYKNVDGNLVPYFGE
jgi:hypothetical protein